MFINRDYTRTAHDDWMLRVRPRLGFGSESVEIRDADGNLVGWQIKPLFE